MVTVQRYVFCRPQYVYLRALFLNSAFMHLSATRVWLYFRVSICFNLKHWKVLRASMCLCSSRQIQFQFFKGQVIQEIKEEQIINKETTWSWRHPWNRFGLEPSTLRSFQQGRKEKNLHLRDSPDIFKSFKTIIKKKIYSVENVNGLNELSGHTKDVLRMNSNCPGFVRKKLRSFIQINQSKTKKHDTYKTK